MILSLLKGMLWGLPFIFAVGPSFFAILHTSMSKGFYSGMQFALGIFLSDTMLLLLSYFGIAQFIQEDSKLQIILGFIGALFLLFYGFYSFLKTKSYSKQNKEIKLTINWLNVFSEIIKGFFINIMNPALWLLWFSIVTTQTSGNDRSCALAFMLGIVIVTLSTDILKSFFANRISAILSPNVVYVINKIMGIVLIGFSVYMLISTIQLIAI